MNLFDLAGKTALITGAAIGLEARMARAIYSAGARVILTARRVDKLEALASELKNALAIEMDVSNKASRCVTGTTLTVDGEISWGGW